MSSEATLVALCSELERLFELDELKLLTQDLLGLDPDDIGGGSAKSAYVKSLARRCIELDSVEALCDAVAAWRDDVGRLGDFRSHGYSAEREVELGEQVGPYLILRQLGEGRLGTVFLARAEGEDVRLKLLHRRATLDRAGLQRFLTASRIIGTLGHPGLPRDVVAGEADGRFFVAHRYIEGQTLAARLTKTGAMHIEEARALIRALLEPLAALHGRKLAHGDVRPENVLIGADENGRDVLVLLDPGSSFLTAQPASLNGHSDRLAALGSAKTISPEQVEGRLPDARSDLYSFGALLYEVLTGRAPFVGRSTAEVLMAHLTREPELPSIVAPAGWIAPDVDDFVTQLLNKDPGHRPDDAETLLGDVYALGSTISEPEHRITPEHLEERVDELLADPTDEMAEEALIAAIRQGGDVARIADAFCMAAELLAVNLTPSGRATRYRLLSRAAKLFDVSLKDAEAAEPLYSKIISLDPSDVDAAAALERLRRRLGKHEEIVEGLLTRIMEAAPGEEKARMLAEIGRVYAQDLGDKEQALIAYAQAFCEDPHRPAYAREVERLAGKNIDAWSEVLQSCLDASTSEMPSDAKTVLLEQMGHWYLDIIARPDLALSCYNAMLNVDPSSLTALQGMATIYRKAQQWPELGNVLLAQADAPGTSGPASRDLRAEAAEILEMKLGNTPGARQLYERVLDQDPTHEKACQALAQIYERAGDAPSYVRVLESRAGALQGTEQLDALCRIGEVYELHLSDIEEAERRYQSVVNKDPTHLEGLHGLDRCLSRLGKFEALIRNLEMQIAVAATPRQKVQLYERIGAVWDEEFLNHARAAEAWENVLDIDSNHDGALTNLARHYRALERWNDVVIIFERHLELLHGDRQRRVEKALGLGRVLGEGLKVPERAIAVYEQVLDIDPGNVEALEAIAALQVGIGQHTEAIEHLDMLARQAPTPEAKAERYLRAAQLLESQHDMDGAIERYKLAVDANPKDRSACMILRAAYVARGDNHAAAELLEQEISHTEGEAARAKLSGEMAALCLDRLRNDGRAESWAKVTLDMDPTNLDALRVLGDIAYEGQRYIEAARFYEQVANRIDALTQSEAVRVLFNYVEALIKDEKGPKAATMAFRLLAAAPDDLEVRSRAAELIFDHGDPQTSFELHWEVVHRAGTDIDPRVRAGLLYRLGESARRAGDLTAALGPLREAADLDPSFNPPLKSLAELYAARQQWEDAVATMYRELDNVNGEERIKLLLEIGDLASQKLKDPSYAAKSYLFALSEQPDNRKILMKLMQLYSEEKDWDRLVKVILKLADFVDDPKQKSKYLLTAGRVAWREMNDIMRGSQLLQRALELDPDNADIGKDGIEVHQRAGNAEALKELLKRQVKFASDAGDKPQMLTALNALAELYLKHFKRLEQAIAVYEAALEVEPDYIEIREMLARLYAHDVDRYRDKAILAQAEILQRDPFRPEAHKMLRRLHTEAKHPDAAWCCCQALYVLGQADRDEQSFFLRMRSEEGASPRNRLSEADFHACVVHKNAEPLLTALFTVIQPAIMAVRSTGIRDAGYGHEHLVDPTQHQYAAAQTIPYAADIMSMPCPPMFRNDNDLGELSFLHTQPPGIVLGTAVIGVALPTQAALFMAARHLSYYRSGMYVRQLVPTSTGLKAWLFAAIRLMTPAFQIPTDIQGPVVEALRALDRGVTGPTRDHLARVVSKALQSGALDLKKWITAIDLTADRAGLIFCDDLQTAVEMIRTSDQRSSSASVDERVEEVYRYSVSEQYFEIRQKLGIALG